MEQGVSDSTDYLGAENGTETVFEGEFLPRDVLERIQACLPEVGRSVTWRGSLWLIGRRRRFSAGRIFTYYLFSCKLDEGVWQLVPVTLPEESRRYCMDLAVYKDRLLMIAMVDDDPDLLLPEAGRGKIWELKDDGGQWRAIAVATAPAYSAEQWLPEACFVGQDGLLYIQLSQHSSKIAVCDLSTKPTSWWLLPPSPLSEYRPGTNVCYLTMPLIPRLDAFI